MRATFKTLFYVNRSKEKNGIVPIMGRVTINGTTAQFSCKRSIPMELWDTKGNCAKGKSKESIRTRLYHHRRCGFQGWYSYPNGINEQQKEKDGRTDKKPVTRLSLS